ncbi:MAG TPA: hypothetical protein VG206_08990 [Terriglobia bacterium]|nr:hypothetical protein [Terriglobia bacterium]
MRKRAVKASWLVAVVLVLVPGMALAQQQNKQNGQSGKQKNQQGNQPNQQVAPQVSPLETNPEGLLPVLPMGPLPRPNGSPNYTNQYVDQSIPQHMNQQLPFYRSMAELQAGGNTSTPNPNRLSNGAINGVAQTGVRGGKNARGLSTQQSNQPNNQHGTGQHANPGQGQGQSP